MIQFDAVHKRFPNGTTAVHDLSLDMPEGGVTVLVGSSGCGKTTTLRMINRMVEPTSGTIRVGGKDVTPKATATEEGAMQNALAVALPVGLQVLPYGMAEDSDALAVTRETARKYGLTSLADLAKHNGELVIGAAPEVKTREVGVVGLKDVYGVEFKEFKSLDSSGPLVKGALRKGDVDVANLFTTDTGIQADDWVVLTDPKNLIPGQHIVPLIADRKADSTVRKALARLGNTLTTAQLTELNRQVDKDKKDPEDVADAYARQHGLAG